MDNGRQLVACDARGIVYEKDRRLLAIILWSVNIITKDCIVNIAVFQRAAGARVFMCRAAPIFRRQEVRSGIFTQSYGIDGP